MESQRKPLTTKYGRRLTHHGVEKKFPSLVVVARWPPYPNFAYPPFEAIFENLTSSLILKFYYLALAVTARSMEYFAVLV